MDGYLPFYDRDPFVSAWHDRLRDISLKGQKSPLALQARPERLTGHDRPRLDRERDEVRRVDRAAIVGAGGARKLELGAL